MRKKDIEKVVQLLRNKKKVCALLAPAIDKTLENFSQCQM